MKILIVEDEKRMGEALVELLRRENYDVDIFTDGNSGCDAAESGIYDIIILDVMLPGKSGFEITSHIRNAGIKTPVLILTAKDSLDDKVNGLDCGADDYLTKPFMSRELLARLRALVRRTVNSTDGTLSFGDIALDANTSALRCKTNGQSIRLSDKEYRIMEYLIANQDRILSREALALKVWGYENDAEYNNVEVYISFTRKKLTFVGSSVEIKAVRGIGYELRYPETAEA